MGTSGGWGRGRIFKKWNLPIKVDFRAKSFEVYVVHSTLENTDQDYPRVRLHASQNLSQRFLTTSIFYFALSTEVWNIYFEVHAIALQNFSPTFFRRYSYTFIALGSNLVSQFYRWRCIVVFPGQTVKVTIIMFYFFCYLTGRVILWLTTAPSGERNCPDKSCER